MLTDESLRERLLELLRDHHARFEELCRVTKVHPLTRKPIKKGDLIDPYPAGASDRKLNAFSRRTGVRLSDSLREWLKISNGGAGFYGVKPLYKTQDVERIWNLYPQWLQRSWFPVADDGFGNFYVQPDRDTVCFVDIYHSAGELTYVVASDMLHFAVFFQEDQLGMHRKLAAELGAQVYLRQRRRGEKIECNPWPFGKKYMLHRDPGLKLVTDLPLAWDKP